MMCRIMWKFPMKCMKWIDWRTIRGKEKEGNRQTPMLESLVLTNPFLALSKDKALAEWNLILFAIAKDTINQWAKHT